MCVCVCVCVCVSLSLSLSLSLSNISFRQSFFLMFFISDWEEFVWSFSHFSWYNDLVKVLVPDPWQLLNISFLLLETFKIYVKKKEEKYIMLTTLLEGTMIEEDLVCWSKKISYVVASC
jgi:hypothetical protein